MAVPDKAETGLEMVEGDPTGLLGQEVLPDGVPGSAMGQGELPRHLSQAQRLQVGPALGAQMAGGPADGRGGIRVEVGDVHPPDVRPIVIAGNADVVVPSQELDALIGRWPVPYQ